MVRFCGVLLSVAVVLPSFLPAGDAGFIDSDTLIFSTTPENPYPVQQVIAADINRDGAMDYFIRQNYTPGLAFRFSAIQLLLNNGDTPPTFTLQTLLSSDTDLQLPMNLGDLDGDGDLDVLYAFSPGTSGVSDIGWLRNGDGLGGTWQDRGIFLSINGSADSIALGDIDRDGDLDFVLNALNDDGKAGYMSNNGDGSAYAFRELPYESAFEQVALGDVDLDGDLDIIASDEVAELLLAFINDGASPIPLFNAEAITDSHAVGYFATGDVTGDRGCDVVAVVDDLQTYCYTRGSASWSFSQIGTDLILRPYLGDITGDGRLDVVVTSDTFSEYAASAVPTANAWRTWRLSGFNYDTGLDFCDADRDGDLDIVKIDSQGLHVLVALNVDPRHTVAFSPDARPVSEAAPGVTSFLAAPMNRDRFPDILAALPNTDQVQSFRNEGYDDFTFDTGRLAISGTDVDGVADLASGDIDRDGLPDAIIASPGSGRIHFLKQLGLSEPAPFLGYQVDQLAGVRRVAVGDLDGDGLLDFVATANVCEGSPIPTCTSQMAVYLQSGDPVLPAGWSKIVVEDSYTAMGDVALADIDLDGDLDIVAGKRQASPPPVIINTQALHWYENDGAATPAFTRHTIASSIGSSGQPDAFRLVDFDGDSDIDVVSATFSSTAVVWYENEIGDGSSWLSTPVTASLSRVRGVDAADFDRDGDMDILIADNDGNSVMVVDNVGSGWITSEIPHSETGPWAVQFQDMNDDGMPDVVVGFDTSGKVLWYENLPAQCQVEVEDVSPVTASGGSNVALARIRVYNTSGNLSIRIGPSLPFSIGGPFGLLKGSEAQEILSSIELWHDQSGDDQFGDGDLRVGKFDSFFSHPVDDDFQLVRTKSTYTELAAPGEQSTYFITANIRSQGFAQPYHPFKLVLSNTSEIAIITMEPEVTLVHPGGAFESGEVTITEATFEENLWMIR